MRYIVVTSIFLVFLGIRSAQAQGKPLMSDPVFGISYDPSKVHFEAAPSRTSRLCPGLREARFWLYAYWRDGETEYFVLSNRKSSVSGAGVVISAGKCTEGLPDWILTGNPEYAPRAASDGNSEAAKRARSIKFTPGVLHGLATDLLRRYTAAFGGKKSFIRAVQKDGLSPNNKMPVVKEEFEKFSKSPQV